MGSHLNGLTTGIYGRAVHTDGSFYVPCEVERYNGMAMKEGIFRLADPTELPGKISARLFSDCKAGPDGFGKNHPRFAPVFFPKALHFRSRPL